eukprot:364478-Chlamydomonas_euryale.AAC.14
MSPSGGWGEKGVEESVVGHGDQSVGLLVIPLYIWSVGWLLVFGWLCSWLAGWVVGSSVGGLAVWAYIDTACRFSMLPLSRNECCQACNVQRTKTQLPIPGWLGHRWKESGRQEEGNVREGVK